MSFSPGRIEEDDYRLSMAISPFAAADESNKGLRVLLVHRLHDSVKAVRRWALRSNGCSTYCEPCKRWVKHHRAEAEAEVVPAEWRCPHCRRLYGVELIVYSELVEDGEED
jgi:uncharacterized protein with PIN domain